MTNVGHNVAKMASRARPRLVMAATLVQDFNLRGKRSAPGNKLRRWCGTVPTGQAQRPRRLR